MDFPDDRKLEQARTVVDAQEKKPSIDARSLSALEEELTEAKNRYSANGWKLRDALLYRTRKLLKEKKRSDLPKAELMKFDRKHRFQIEIFKAQYDRSRFPKVQDKYLMDDDKLLLTFLDSLKLTNLSTERLLTHNEWVRSKHRRFSHAGLKVAKATRTQLESTIDKQVFAGKTFQVFRMDGAPGTPVTGTPVTQVGSEPEPPATIFEKSMMVLFLILLSYSVFRFRRFVREPPPPAAAVLGVAAAEAAPPPPAPLGAAEALPPLEDAPPFVQASGDVVQDVPPLGQRAAGGWLGFLSPRSGQGNRRRGEAGGATPVPFPFPSPRP